MFSKNSSIISSGLSAPNRYLALKAEAFESLPSAESTNNIYLYLPNTMYRRALCDFIIKIAGCFVFHAHTVAIVTITQSTSSGVVGAAAADAVVSPDHHRNPIEITFY